MAYIIAKVLVTVANLVLALTLWAIQFDVKTEEPEAGLLNKSSCFAPALTVAKSLIVKYIILVTL
jgi:hypothetical protein